MFLEYIRTAADSFTWVQKNLPCFDNMSTASYHDMASYGYRLGDKRSLSV